MKTLLTTLPTAALLVVALTASGFALDAASLLAIAFVAGLTGMAVGDCSRKPGHRAPAVKAAAPVRRTIRRSRSSAGFASVIVFETTCV